MEDFEKEDEILVVGKNKGKNNKRMLGDMRREEERGERIVELKKVRERGMERFEEKKEKMEMMNGGREKIKRDYLKKRIGGDIEDLRGMEKEVLDEEDEEIDEGRNYVIEREFMDEKKEEMEE